MSGEPHFSISQLAARPDPNQNSVYIMREFITHNKANDSPGWEALAPRLASGQGVKAR